MNLSLVLDHKKKVSRFGSTHQWSLLAVVVVEAPLKVGLITVTLLWNRQRGDGCAGSIFSSR